MNLRTIGIVIGREYSTRVRKKSFLLTTFITPILFAALCLVPAFLMTNMKESAKRLAVVDNSGIVLPYLEDGETVSYVDMSSSDADSVKVRLAELGCDGVLVVSPLDSAAKTISAEIYSPSPLGIDLEENLGNRLDDALENYRVESYGIEGLAQIMEDVKVNVPLRSYTISDDGEEKVSESGVYMLVSMILGMVIYMFIVMFGAMVMSSVIEEKSSRVVEVLVSSVKATELMFGKIIGIAFVALTQFLLWIVLTVAIVGVVGTLAGPSLASSLDPAEMSQMAGMDAGQLASMTGSSELGVIISSLSNMHLGTILVCFLIFFVLGYMLYASLFAAIGSAVENEGDSSQLQMPVTVPLMIAFFVALYAFKAPESTLVFWCSLIPFTSPIVMLARLPYGVPTWEIVLSIILLALTFALCAWLSAKIYKVGILMFGKKTSWKDLWKWLKQK